LNGNYVKFIKQPYYRDSHAAFVVFDVSSESSFKGSVDWKDDIDSKVRLADGSKIPVILLANKVC
jgi:GTPase SAR1 family protein